MNETDFAVTPSAPSETERQWAAGAHAGALVAALLTSWLVGVAGAAAALAVWFFVRDKYPFAERHAREAVNFNLTMLIYAAIAFAIGMLLLGATAVTLGIGAIVTVPLGILLTVVGVAIAVMWLVCGIIAAVKAYQGEEYRYPLTIRLFK